MKTDFVMEPEMLCDASLVELCLAGDRDAFGQIVVRYQSSICALAYSACGNVARSEDIAQEVFITAWRKLNSLQEPARFKAWLYGIARNIIHNTFRQHTRNPLADADALDEAMEPPVAADNPDEEAISREEETILWHVLSGLPQVYREPMVLFYRQNESIPQVAEALGISEEAARQRLSRGRALLNERVTKVIQSGLRRSGPANTFAVGVIAALPMLGTATAAKGAVVGAVTAQGASGQTSGVVGFLKSMGSFAGLIALPATLGTFFGYKLGQDAAGLPHQRQSAAKFWRIFGVGVVLFLFLPLLLTMGIAGFLQGETRRQFLSVMTFLLGVAYPFVLGALVLWGWQRRRKQPAPEPSPSLRQSEFAPPAGEITPPGNLRILRRLVLFLTVAAAGLLVFCYTDTNRNVERLSPEELRALINQSAPGELRASILVRHYRSLWGKSPDTFQSLWVEVHKHGKATYHSARVDEATLELLAQRGIECPTFVQGRDFELLGAPGRLLSLLAAFVLATGALFLLKTRRTGIQA